ncbi:rCG50998 [Rattus norvegicus]|uniref:RCG50998 n=1 Tax=Rattus norvegicus TaxID=10116 RepID=A6KGB5_RAT|nr:rCG50998 [Rattus norvegicus]
MNSNSRLKPSIAGDTERGLLNHQQSRQRPKKL